MAYYFNYYKANIKESIPIGIVTLDKVLESIKDPKPNIKEIFAELRTADEKRKAELKTKLYSFTPCVYFSSHVRRKYENITNFTGLLCLDFDKLTPDYSVDFKDFIFKEYQFIKACWLSASKKGVRAIVKIPTSKSVDEFKTYFYGIRNEFMQYRGFDSALQNPVLPMFLSYDENILIREESAYWTKKHHIMKSEPTKQYNTNTTGKEGLVLYKINDVINKIIDNGHPQLRAASYLLGGYVGAGYIDESTAYNEICKMIESNTYLSIKPQVYKQTAKTMIKQGQNEPIYINL
jgi:Skp family chaperone for outer membrane proteins